MRYRDRKTTKDRRLAAFHARLCWGCAVAPLLLSANATAQELPEITEIVVTAERREQTIQDVPLTVQAFDRDQLKNFRIDSTTDLVNQIQGLGIVTPFGEGTNPNFFLRGLGVLDFGDVTEAPVAVYYDDVYLGTQAAHASPIYDLERVEVLKGPQGTLYGRNSTAGVISHVFAKPTEEFEAGLALQTGSFGQRQAEVYVSGPLAKFARGRISAYTNQDNGWQRSLTTGRDDYGEVDVASARAQLEVDFSDRVTLLLSGTYTRIDGTSPLYPVFGQLEEDLTTICAPSDVAAGNCFTGLGEQFIDDPRTGLSEEPPLPNELEFGLYIATLTADLGFGELTSISSYQTVDKRFQEDSDAGAQDLGLTGYLLDAKQFSQEVRLAGSFLERVNYVAGIFYFNETRDSQSAALEPDFFGTDADQESRSIAFFGQVDYQVTNSLALIGGLRYTRDRKEIDVVTNADFFPFGPFFGPDSNSIDTNKLTGRIGLSWDATENLMIYGNFSTGFKAAGFNANFVTESIQTEPVAEETIRAFEVGAKSSFWSGRARLNAAAFYYDIGDLQGIALDTFVATDGVVRNVTRLQAIGDADIYGMEAELSVQPTQNLFGMVSIGVLDTEIQSGLIAESFFDNEFPDGVVSIDGNELPNAPRFSINGLVSYTVPINKYGFLTGQTDFNWRSDFAFTYGRDDVQQGDAYGLWNATVRWQSPNERYSAEVFVDNILDTHYLLARGSIFPDSAVGAWGRPRVWGVRLGADF